MKNIFFILTLTILFSGLSINAQQKVKLWKEAPTENGITTKESINKEGTWITNISEAELIIYPAEKNNNSGLAVIICPGGGYGGLAIKHEGHQFAKWLNTQGITGVVLKYRLPNQNKEVPLDDAWQAIRYVRENAEKLGVKKIGIAGFSAGGHLASTASTHFSVDINSTKPDFSILFYPVITMGEATDAGTKKRLIGEQPSDFDIYMYSNEKQVTADTPPTILLLSNDDKVVKPINSSSYYNALLAKNIPATMYIFPDGGHGWGMNQDFKYHKQMLELLSMWLTDIKESIKQ